MLKENKRILIIDDEPKLIEVMRSYLEKSGYTVFESDNGINGLALCQKVNPHLIILDLMLPDIAGEEICRIIRNNSKVPIIMLSAKAEEENILAGLEIGADDYITKPFSPRQVVARVAALLRRSHTEEIGSIYKYRDGDLTIDDNKHEVKKGGIVVNLTPNEYKLLITMVKFPKKAFTREELVCIALGEDYEGYDRTIDTHIKNLRQKIESDTKDPRYVLTIYGIGYRFGGE